MVAELAAPAARPRLAAPAVDVLMGGLLAVAVAASLARGDSPYAALGLATLTGWLTAIAWFDARTLRAPNRAVLPGVAASLLFAATLGRDTFLGSLGGGLLAFLLVGVVAAAGRGRMGAGDVKYAAFAGAVVGLRSVLPMLAVGFIAGGVIAAAVLALRLRERSASMAFTPLLALGVVAAVVFAPVIATR